MKTVALTRYAAMPNCSWSMRASSGQGRIDAGNLREAHRRLESGGTIGKLVLAGW